MSPVLAPLLGMAGALSAQEDPSLKPGLEVTDVSPGTVGFLATLLMVVLVILVALDHTRRQRRLKNRFDYAMAREEQERRAQQGPASSAGPGEDAAAPAEGRDGTASGGDDAPGRTPGDHPA